MYRTSRFFRPATKRKINALSLRILSFVIKNYCFTNSSADLLLKLRLISQLDNTTIHKWRRYWHASLTRHEGRQRSSLSVVVDAAGVMQWLPRLKDLVFKPTVVWWAKTESRGLWKMLRSLSRENIFLEHIQKGKLYSSLYVRVCIRVHVRVYVYLCRCFILPCTHVYANVGICLSVFFCHVLEEDSSLPDSRSCSHFEPPPKRKKVSDFAEQPAQICKQNEGKI